ncbi:hypothetical protein AMS68_007803 [Peltaster fructicola]|uniref:PUM-HD domain-containing protein n=1 Tax=Peltaster fructicola TaxID=286661 RepID=A0A6H0Y5N6_9PEZI|nr:hypothetical protein AMS68_007803 [Peltaster fructicola]
MAAIKRKAPYQGGTTPDKKHRTSSGYDKKSSYDPKRQSLQQLADADDVDGKETSNGTSHGADKQFKLETSSAEAHAKQRALAKERKASKPNADLIARSKKLWEQLRRKSHVSLEERKKLVAELFSIVDGRVRDFVFKHDSVRVVQCALKYANLEQRRSITKELHGDIRTLAESRYGKFLVAKMIMSGDQQIRDLIIPEFYGHVRRLVNHPEASWILDDIYRQIASPEQKALMLREWYGAEFALLQRKPDANVPVVASTETAELSEILSSNPEKRRPILQYLHEMINGLVQKKMTGFTMLHDAMLQYFLALVPGGEEQRAFLDEMLGDIDAETEGGGGDLYKNLAFTKSGSRLVCLAIAYGTPKDRKIILRVFKDNVETMAYDQYAKMVLVAGLDVPDDTQMTTKTIYRELLAEKIEDKEERMNKVESLVLDLNARVPILFQMEGTAKWLYTNNSDKALLEEVHTIRSTTSKKAPEVRQKELLQYLANILLDLVADRAGNLVRTSFGWQFITEVLLELNGEHKQRALEAVASLAEGEPAAEGHIAHDPAAGRALKALVGGGPFDPKEKKVKLVEPRLAFAEQLWPIIKSHIVDWACSPASFVVVALLESEDVSDVIKTEVKKALKKERAKLQAVTTDKKDKDKAKTADGKKVKASGNPGAKLLLEKLN